MGKHGLSECRVFQGVKYRRYPESPQRDLRVYFTSSTGRRLHRDVWSAQHGPIPRKHHIHHRDGDPLNNDVENLECVLGSEHLRKHSSQPEHVARIKQHLPAAREAAAAWHRSAVGREWHSQHGRAVMEKRNASKHPCTCVVCGAGFESPVESAEVCSPKCHARRRRESGKDDEQRTCAECSKTFTCNRFRKPKPGCCTRSCAIRRSNRERAARLQPHR